MKFHENSFSFHVNILYQIEALLIFLTEEISTWIAVIFLKEYFQKILISHVFTISIYLDLVVCKLTLID